MQVCNSSQTTMPTSHHLVFLQAGCPSCHPTNSVKALKACNIKTTTTTTTTTTMIWATCAVMYVVWHTGHQSDSVLPLEDEDAQTQMEDGWKRINTLQHYNVQNNSTMHLVADRQGTSSIDDGEPHVIRSADGRLTH